MGNLGGEETPNLSPTTELDDLNSRLLSPDKEQNAVTFQFYSIFILRVRVLS